MTDFNDDYDADEMAGLADVERKAAREDGLLTCRRCTIRYAWARDHIDAVAEVKRLRAALTEIKATCGKVCPGFELCDHVSCASSYGAWAIADQALALTGGDS